MRWMPLPRNWLILALLLPLQAAAHDYWIEPRTFRPTVNEPVPIVLRVGQDFTGTSQPLIPQWFTDYAARGPSGTRPILGHIGDDPAGVFVPDAAGTWVIGYRSTQAFVNIEPPRFKQYLEMEGLEWVMADRARRGESETNARELYSRCAKSVVLAGDAPPGGGFDVVLGYTLELIPERNPYALLPGDELPVRLLYLGRPLGGILIIAFRAEDPAVKQALRTADDGRVSIRLAEAGTWLIKGVHIIRVAERDDRAEWESFWASLTFRLADG